MVSRTRTSARPRSSVSRISRANPGNSKPRSLSSKAAEPSAFGSSSDPEIHRVIAPAFADVHRLLRLPVSHVVPMGDDAGARAQRLQARPQLAVEIGGEKQHHHGGVAEIDAEEVLGAELDALGHARAA